MTYRHLVGHVRLLNSPETADLYREGSGKNSRSVKVICSGALSIELFEGSRWRSALRGALYGYSIGDVMLKSGVWQCTLS